MKPIFSALLIIVVLSAPAIAERRLGLIIGNDAYSDVPALRKAVADATAVSDSLRDQGFEIITVLDAPRRQMNRRISEFTSRLEPGDTAFVFYAGHGVEIDGENYLLPTDIAAPASGEHDFIKSESISLSSLLDRVRATGARTTVAVIDACRNNPFKSNSGRSIGASRGLGRIAAPEGTFVIFSAGAGQLALDELTRDDPAANSVFTRLLLPRLTQPGLELRELVAGLRVDVRNLARTVNHQQFPAYYDELLGEFYFSSTGPEPVQTAQPDQMTRDFELARSLGTTRALKLFLDRYKDRPEDFSYKLAEVLLNRGQDQTGPDMAAATPEPDPAPRRDEAGKPVRQIIRETQAALNSAGCDAGGADGVAGPRTRRAFARFINDTSTDLAPADLGSERALRAILYSGTTACKPVVAATPSPNATPAPKPAAKPGLAGRWVFKANCALWISSTGSVRYKKISANFYQGNLSDSLGNKGTVEVHLNGRDLSGKTYFPTGTDIWRARLSPDGRSYTGSGSNTCSFSVWRG